MEILSLTLILFWLNQSSAFETVEFTSQKEIRPNHGVIFQPTNRKLITTSSAYSVIFTIDRPEILPLSLCDEGMPNNMIAFCTMLRPLDKEMYNMLTRSINEAQQGIETLLHSPIWEEREGRASRALLGIIGKISRSLFGTATVGDVARITCS